MVMTPREIPLPRIDQVFFVVEYLGVFVGALSGALSAIRDSRYKYDIVGVLGLALSTALGGGIIRDVILQQGPPLAFENINYLLTAFAGAGVAIVFGKRMGRGMDTSMIIIDAAALGLFSVAGTTRALNAGLKNLPSLLLGITTGVGGGSLRDVLSGRPPRIFEHGQLYAIPSLIGSAIFLLSEVLHYSRTVSTVLAILTCFFLRIAAWKFDWRTESIEF